MYLRGHAVGDGRVRNELGGVDTADFEFGGDFADDLVGFGVLREGDERAVRAEDAGFLAGDVGDGGAEVVHVVERDVGDDAELGRDDVGGVEAAAEAYFEDGDVDLLFGEVEEGDGGEGLKIAGRVR